MDSSDIKKRYVVVGNSDTTEGRGHSVDVAFCEDLKVAYEIQQSGKYGTMGTKDCSIYEEPYIEYEGQFFFGSRTQLFGYKNYKYDWIVPNPFLTEDPEYAEFLRLKEKFKEYL